MRYNKKEQEKMHALNQAHTFSSFHSEQLKTPGALAGCFYCEKFFSATDIKKWIDGDETALCPHCGIDSVLMTGGYESGSYQGHRIDAVFLAEMNKYWFAKLTSMKDLAVHPLTEKTIDYLAAINDEVDKNALVSRKKAFSDHCKKVFGIVPPSESLYDRLKRSIWRIFN